ncbi:MAG: thioredoxin family protein [Bacteriovoracaceae bacterium]|nr:thioredoxin family protein [Bacteriovoracaceae bacterium]
MRAAVFLCVIITSFQIFAKVPTGIDWYQGTVESAFKEAKKTKRPLFLYWGAIWCPPCNQIKKTIFSTKPFKKMVKKFIPVYLDGDEKRAQIWSDKLGTRGYPTMLVLSPLGKEIMRLPTGVSVSEYVNLMDLTLKKMLPISKIVENALQGKASDDDWKLMAGYSWYQDNKKLKAKTFKQLYDTVPKRLLGDRSRFFFLYMSAHLQENKKATPKELAQFIPTLESFLDSPRLIRANLETFFYEASDIVSRLFAATDPKRELFIKKWLKAMEDIENDEGLSLDERFSALAPIVYFHILKNKPPKKEGNKKDKKEKVTIKFPKAIQQRISNKASWVDKNALDSYSRQSVMSTVVWLLRKTNQVKLAQKYAIAELAKSSAPWYFISSLAYMSEQKKENKKALKWLEKGWQVAKGHATRLQWGTSYIMGILRLAPKNEKLLKEVSLQVMDEILVEDDAFYGRNKKRLQRLAKKLVKWNEDKSHTKVLQDLKVSLSQKCETVNVKNSCLDWVKTF